MSSLEIATSESSFRSRALDEAVRPRGSRDETQPKKSRENPSDSTRRSISRTYGRKGYMGDQEVFLHSTVLKSSVLHAPCVLHQFLVPPPPFSKSRDENSVKGGGL
jgi:hypothetical protein